MSSKLLSPWYPYRWGGTIPAADLAEVVPGQYDHILLVQRGTLRKALAPEVTEAAAALMRELQELIARAEADIAPVIAALGYLPPVPYEAGLVIDNSRITVEYGGQVYAPILEKLPFTTSGEFEAENFRLIQGVTGADLASAYGAAMVGFQQFGTGAAVRTLLAKARERVTVDDYYQGESDYTQAFERAAAYLATRGGGIISCPKPSYQAQRIVVRRNQIVEGLHEAGVELIQAGGANQNFIVSESFDVLTGSGLDVAGDARVPSWFGLRNVRVNGNAPSNQAGMGVAFYGAAIILDNVIVMNAATDGVYTEYAANVTGIGSWQYQEEGYIRNLVSRNNGGVGWRFRGPHNAFIDNAICMLNGDWGFVSEIAAGVYNGAPTYVSCLHCYSNDMAWTPEAGRARRNMYIGTNMSCALLVVDGGHAEVRGSNSLFSIVKQYFGGQGGDSLVLSGSNIQIGSHYGIMRNDAVSSGFTSLTITGDFNQIGSSNISGTLNRFDGVRISGISNSIGDLVAQNCRVALTVTGSRNRVKGYLANNLTGLHYNVPTDVHGGYNTLELRIRTTDQAAMYVSGDGPVPDKDEFRIKANGLSIGERSTRKSFEVGALSVDTTEIQTVAVPHELLYAPRRRDVRVALTGLTGGTQVEFAWGPRVSAVDASNITIMYKCRVAGGTGAQMSVAGSAEIR